MYEFLEGTLAESHPLCAVVNCGGVGYLVHTPLSSSSKLPARGEKVRLYTRLVVRDDAHELYGFVRREERDFFSQITQNVSGVGPKVALNLFSRISFEQIREAISRGDSTLLATCPGVGKKTASKIILEMRDRIEKETGISSKAIPPSVASDPEANHAANDAINALVQLGYRLPEAEKAIAKAINRLGSPADTEDLIREALR